MKRHILMAVLFCALLSLMLSCGYKTIKHGEEISEEQASTIITGKTTKRDIFMEFGEPTKTMDKEKVFFYSWTKGGKGHFLGFGSGSAESKTLVVVFDDNDIVQRHRITRGATSGGASIGD